MDLQHENENAQDQFQIQTSLFQGEIRMSTTLDPRACKLKVSCAEAEEAELELQQVATMVGFHSVQVCVDGTLV